TIPNSVGGGQGPTATPTAPPTPPTPVIGGNVWAPKATMTTARAYLAVADATGKLYAVGGANSGAPCLTTVEQYDPGSNSWTAMTSMNLARRGLALVAANGKLYAIGGDASTVGNSVVYKTVEEYDPVANTWTTRTDMPTARTLL